MDGYKTLPTVTCLPGKFKMPASPKATKALKKTAAAVPREPSRFVSRAGDDIATGSIDKVPESVPTEQDNAELHKRMLTQFQGKRKLESGRETLDRLTTFLRNEKASEMQVRGLLEYVEHLKQDKRDKFADKICSALKKSLQVFFQAHEIFNVNRFLFYM